jgi:predicted  nucleic acid-binding Zn ribbon protein
MGEKACQLLHSTVQVISHVVRADSAIRHANPTWEMISIAHKHEVRTAQLPR